MVFPGSLVLSGVGGDGRFGYRSRRAKSPEAYVAVFCFLFVSGSLRIDGPPGLEALFFWHPSGLGVVPDHPYHDLVIVVRFLVASGGRMISDCIERCSYQ